MLATRGRGLIPMELSASPPMPMGMSLNWIMTAWDGLLRALTKTCNYLTEITSPSSGAPNLSISEGRALVESRAFSETCSQLPISRETGHVAASTQCMVCAGNEKGTKEELIVEGNVGACLFDPSQPLDLIHYELV
jgi:hypothetical protein